MKEWLLRKIYNDSRKSAQENPKYIQFQKESKEIVEDFKATANAIIKNDLEDLVHIKKNTENSKVPVLAEKWLRQSQNPLVKAVLIDAIRSSKKYKQNKELESWLLEEYSRTPIGEFDRKNAIANYFVKYFSDDNFEKIKEIIEKETEEIHGRGLLVLALGKSKKKEAEDFVLEFLHKGEMVNMAIQALGEMKSKKSQELITAHTDSKDEFTRKVATQSLKNIKS